MLYDVSLRITQSYARPAVAGRHALRLLPATLRDEQTTIAASLAIAPPPEERTERIDFWGAHVIEAAFREPHERIELSLRARVRRRAPPLQLDLSPRLPCLAREIAEQRSLTADAPHHYVAASARAPLVPEVTALARAATTPDMTARGVVEAVGRAVHGAMAYDVGATTVETPMEDAFRARRGVCQDLSHVMISGLRGLGVPAGYVSGFLRTLPPPGRPRLEGADAMHAWVRAWCGVEAGWLEYDPTNAVFVRDDHIVIARGRDYADVAPVRGVVRTAGEQTSDHAVDIVLLDET